jgi:type I restriction-modification system DNA methylase subunit
MALFQKSVQKKFINALDKSKVETAYQRLLTYFGNPIIQENIRLAKEEQFQEGFLNQLFVEILGYRMSPQPFFNLITEQKNEKNSKKADGAILKNDKPIAVIELKSLKTVDLQSIELQAFSYKNNQSQCVYVITSNFQKVRFYIENAIDWEEFDLFNLSKERFQLLYLCLHAEHLLADLPLRVKKDSVQKEEDITKKLYNDYAGFKKALFKDILSKDKSLDKLVLFKKTQKLLDRFLFIFFAEDKGLLPPNSVKEIVNQWNTLKDLDAYQPLYNRFKQYFGYLNHGHQTPQYSIFAYNGGLFAPDAFLDNLTISDGLLYNYTQLLSGYDFETDVDTNILGHIFEHSLNETDEIAASATHTAVDKSKTKRKKDGIFYTPRYITKYIVENTVGALCQRKLDELGIDPNNIDIHADKETKNAVCKKIHRYRDWLLSITILDPACGSGAFLNQALTFLMEEHQRIDAMFKSLYDVPITLTDNVIQILENNIFGVDINEESVEIARLSLWLRTAKVGRKLNDLSRNVLCGNSLISDPDVAGASAFDWQKAFPQVFEKGGFDVVIGNPPYGASFTDNEKNYLKQVYEKVHIRTPESYNYFVYKMYLLTNPNAALGVIIPSSFLNQIEFEKTRKVLIENSILTKIISLGDAVFQDVATPTCIIVADKAKRCVNSLFSDLTKYDRNKLMDIVENPAIYQDAHSIATNQDCSFIVKKNQDLLKKCYQFPTLKTIAEEVATGVSSGFDKAYVFTKDEIKNKKLEIDLLKKMVIGGEINRYSLEHFSEKSLIYITSEDDIKLYPNIENELIQHKETLLKRREAANGKIEWYALNWARRKKLFEEPKILIRQTANRILATYDENKWYCLKSGLIIQLSVENELNYKYLLCILNSKVMDFIYQDLVNEGDRVFPEVKPVQLFKLPIPIVTSSKQTLLIDLADKMLSLHAQLHEAQTEFQQLLLDNFTKITINRAIENWHQGDFGAFKKVLEKQKIEIPLKKQKEWREMFETEKAAYLSLQTQIAQTETAIDTLVYALYDLTDEEIQIIENQ